MPTVLIAFDTELPAADAARATAALAHMATETWIGFGQVHLIKTTKSPETIVDILGLVSVMGNSLGEFLPDRGNDAVA